ncbi:MAG: 16S rRNA (guanine(527)-N(7))-methyltransferase RsmG [Rhodospirillales bacterium]|nr:16S rRNA (guanine(527)-N(7))-methyltransferase RsmG [Rhodospirillales bacterium]
MTRSDQAIPLTPEGFQEIYSASDEALENLKAYVALLNKWQQKINLVSNDSLADVWRRHVLDSAQLSFCLEPEIKTIADIGSGAGFPGMVLAILGGAEGADIHLIESNERKCAFLKEVSRATGAGVIIHHNRVEKLRDLSVDLVVSRAVAPLEKLLQYANPLLKNGGQCLFLKGKKWSEELTEAQKKWIIKDSSIQSLSDPSGMILKLKEIRPRDDS